MNILILTDELPRDISNVNVDIITNAIHLSKRGHEVFLLSHAGSKIKEDGFSHLPLGYDVSMEKDSPLSFLMRNITFFSSTITKIKDISPDLILSMGGGQMLINFMMGLFLSKLFRKPMVSEWRGSELLLKDSMLRNISKRFILRHSSLNILRSVPMRSKALRIEPDAETVILPSKGVDIEKFHPVETNEKMEKVETELLFVGRLHNVKGLPHLLEAFRRVEESHLEVRLTIVGKGPMEKDLKEKAEALSIDDSIEFLGEIDHDELPNYYRCADIFVLPSLSEGLSNVIMEAMACGLPVVATDVGGNSELIESEKGGFLVDPGDSEELTRSLIDLIEHPEFRKEMGDFNRDLIKKYSQEKVLRKRTRILEELPEKVD